MPPPMKITEKTNSPVDVQMMAPSAAPNSIPADIPGA
jgi:hypothetical protein